MIRLSSSATNQCDPWRVTAGCNVRMGDQPTGAVALHVSHPGVWHGECQSILSQPQN